MQPLERARLFASAVRNELKRVTWPTGREVYATTLVVIVTSILLGLYLWGLDVAAEYARAWVLRRFIG
jgi:preprotein translocase subunit SecE